MHVTMRRLAVLTVFQLVVAWSATATSRGSRHSRFVLPIFAGALITEVGV